MKLRNGVIKSLEEGASAATFHVIGVGQRLPVRPAEEMQVVLLEKTVAIPAHGLFDQLLVHEELDDVTRSYRRPTGKRAVGDESLLVIRRKLKAAFHGDTDGDALADIEPTGAQAELAPPLSFVRLQGSEAGRHSDLICGGDQQSDPRWAEVQ